MRHIHTESGNVLFYILIGVVLFGVLTVAMNYSGQGGNPDYVSEEKAVVFASEIMESAERISTAISKLRLRGCTLAQISFENTKVSGYTNGSAPSNKTCHVFSIEGGELNWPDFSGEMFDQTWSAEADFGHPIFTIKNEIPQLGQDGGTASSYEMLMLVEGVKTGVCEQINERTNGSTTINTAAEVETKYDGTLNTTGVYTFPATFNGMRQACYQDNNGADSGTLTYYYAIVIR